MLFWKRIVCFALILLHLSTNGQDTVFVQRHPFDSPVRDVFKADKELFVKTGKGMFRLENDKWISHPSEFTKPFVFYENDFFEADFLPNKYIFDPKGMADLIPQHALSTATVAETEHGFFLAVAGSLYEYAVNKNYGTTYNRMSVRDIFFDRDLKVVSTYSGIFINDTIQARSPRHSNGPMCKVKNRIFLCADQLYEFIKPDSFRVIPSGENAFAGYSRKVIEYMGRMYSLNTKSLNVFDSAMEMRPIHQGYEYYDMEVVQGKLLFSTQTGEVFMYDGQKTSLLAKLATRVRDIYSESGIAYFSSDKGVFTIRDLKPSTLVQFANTPYTVMVLVDRFRNIWISTENGMFIKPDKTSELVSYIPGVEFNRGALAYHNDSIYAGSIEGVYGIDTYHAMKNVIPVALSLVHSEKNKRRNLIILISFIALTLAAISWLAYRSYRKRSLKLDIPHKETTPKLTLDNLRDIIREKHILTVEGLAEYFGTSTVQLNREFKIFDITPGKFLREVKLQYARELLDGKTPMEEVVRVTGYSASYLQKELQKGHHDSA